MRLITAEFKNFCQHKDLKIDFTPNLNAILGPNGAGKTNLLNGIYFALTGEMRGHGINSDNINQLAGKTDPSYVKLRFEHAGLKAEICRGLQNVGSTLEINGQKKITKVNDINDKIEEVIGLPRKIISDFIFIEQNKVSSFLSMRPSDRAIALQRLFGTHYCERLWTTIGEYMKGVVVPSPRIDIDVVNKRIITVRERLSKLSDSLQSCPVPEDWDIKSDPDFLLKSRWEKGEDLKHEIKELKDNLSILGYTLSQTEDSIKDLNDKIVGIDREIESLELDKYRSILDRWKLYDKMTSTRERLEAELESLEKEWKEQKNPGPAPELIIKEEELVKFFNTTKELEIELHNLNTFLKSINKINDTAICPTCSSEIPATDISKKSERFNILKEEVSSRKNRLKISKDYFDSVAAYRSWTLDYKSRATKLAERMEEISDFMTPPEVSKEESEESINRYKILSKQKKEYLSKLKILESSSISSKVRIDVLKDSLIVKQKCLDELDLPDDIESASRESEEILKIKEKAYKERLRMIAEMQSLSEALELDEKSALDASKILVKASRYRNWLDILEGARMVLHKEALPKLISHKYLLALENDINSILEELSAAFRVKTSDDLNFIAKFSNGYITRGERLSTGQKSILSIAMRIVVNATFAGDIGLLSLDEPTEGLDSDNLQGLEIALRRLQSLSRDRGLQCLLVTHEKALEPLFDNVITLSAPV